MVYVLFHMPYGCPAHDVQILGVFKSEDGIINAKLNYINQGGYPSKELIIEEKELEE